MTNYSSLRILIASLRFNNCSGLFEDIYEDYSCVVSIIKCPAESPSSDQNHPIFFFQERSIGFGPHWDCMKLNAFEYRVVLEKVYF